MSAPAIRWPCFAGASSIPAPGPLNLSLLLSWRNTCGWFTNTDPSASVHFRDDGSPEHNYRAFHRRPAVVNATAGGMAPAGMGLLLEGERCEPLAEGQGQWCLAVADGLATANGPAEVMRCSRWNPAGDGAELWEPFAREGAIPDRRRSDRSRGERTAERRPGDPL
jgi:non-lysosomal glucosylceramidase